MTSRLITSRGTNLIAEAICSTELKLFYEQLIVKVKRSKWTTYRHHLKLVAPTLSKCSSWKLKNNSAWILIVNCLWYWLDDVWLRVGTTNRSSVHRLQIDPFRCFEHLEMTFHWSIKFERCKNSSTWIVKMMTCFVAFPSDAHQFTRSVFLAKWTTGSRHSYHFSPYWQLKGMTQFCSFRNEAAILWKFKSIYCVFWYIQSQDGTW